MNDRLEGSEPRRAFAGQRQWQGAMLVTGFAAQTFA